MLYAINPVGFGSMLLAGRRVDPGLLRRLRLDASSRTRRIVAVVLALVLPPILAVATKGRYYLRRTDDGIDLPMYDEHGNPSGET